MGWFASLVIAFCTGVYSLFATGVLANFWTRWSEVSDREGGRGYAVVSLALIGFILGCVLGLVVARWVAGSQQPGGWKSLGLSLGAVSGLLLLITGVCYLATEHAPEIDGHSLSVEVELRSQDGAPRPSEEFVRECYVILYAVNRRSRRWGHFRPEDLQREGDAWLLKCQVHLHSSGAGRLLTVTHNKETLDLPLPYAGQPTRADTTWSPRVPVPFLASTVRYRLHVHVPEPPAPRVDPEEAAFAALSENSPLEAWLPYLVSPNQPRQKAALDMITARTPELQILILEGPPEAMRRALRGAGMIMHPPATLAGPVREIGRRLKADLEKFVRTKPEEDPTYAAAGEIESTFGDWYIAVASLHRAGHLDGVAEFEALRELAARRPDSQALSGVVRVSDHFLREWKR